MAKKLGWYKDFFRECGREVSLAQTILVTVQTWSITLTLGVISALVAIGTSAMKSEQPLSDHILLGMWILSLVAFVLLTRFFVRSAIALSSIHRWVVLQKQWYAICHKGVSCDHPGLLSELQLYYENLNSTIPMRKLFYDNLRLTFGWLYVIVAIPILVGLRSLPKDAVFWAAILVWASILLWEAYGFIDYRQMRHAPADEVTSDDRKTERDKKKRKYDLACSILRPIAIGVSLLAGAQAAFVFGFIPFGYP